MAYDDENDFDNDLDLHEKGSPEHTKIYDPLYVRGIKNATEGMDTEEVDEVIDELKGIRYNMTDNPEQDAELNVLRSRNVIRQKSRLDATTESYLKYQAQTSGKSFAEVKREYRKLTRGVK